MKKKSIIIYILLLLLIIKPYIDINYSNEGNSLFNMYSFGYNSACSQHTNSWYEAYDNSKHRVVCGTCGPLAVYGTHGNYSYMISTNYASAWGPGVTCDYCGYTYKNENTTSHTHTLGSWENAGSYHKRTCTASGCDYYENGEHSYTKTCSCGKVHVCSLCGKRNGNCTTSVHTCSYGSWYNYNSSYHRRDCSCGYSYEQEGHSFTSQCSSCRKYHVCSVCGAKEGICDSGHTHTYGSWMDYTSTHHRKVCTSCGSVYQGDHTFTKACSSCGAKHICSVCDRKNGSCSHTHSYGSWQDYSESKHIQYCTNASCWASQQADHTWSDYVCDVNGSTDTRTCSTCSRRMSIECTHSITVTVSASPVAGGTVSGTISCKPGATVNISATPSTGYSFSSWTISGGTLGSSTSVSTTVKTSSSNVTVTANFTKNKYTLTVNPSGLTWEGGTNIRTFEQEYGTTKTINNATGTVTGYTVTFNANGGTTSTSSLTSTKSFNGWSNSGSGSFSEMTYTYGAGNGTLTASLKNDAITLPTISREGYNFKGWYDSSGNNVGTINASYTPSNNITLTAKWKQQEVQITVTAGSNGKIYPGTTKVAYGSSHTFYIIPNSGYKISNVLVDGTSVGAIGRYTFSNIKTAHTISATFEAESTGPKVNKPLVSENMIPVIWNGVQWEIVGYDDYRWYNYNQNVGKWANVMLRDGMNYINDSGVSTSVGTIGLPELIGKVVDSSNTGSMYVWVPRYSYKISGEVVDIKWSDGLTDYTLDDYNLHPAFRYAGYYGGDTSTDSNYSSGLIDSYGVWIGKYEAKKINDRIRIVDFGTRWSNVNIGTAFNTAKNMANLQDYYLSTSYFESHMLKNSEWGAIAYLQKYATSAANSNKHNIMEIDKTDNKSEFVSSYHELIGGTVNYNARQYGAALVDANERLVDKVSLQTVADDISNYDSYKNYYGIAVGETSTIGSGETSLEGGKSVIPAGNLPFMVRTSRFGYSNNTGVANSLSGFRTVLSLLQTPTISKYNVAVLRNDNAGTITGIGSYSAGATITLTETPKSGYSFVGWSVVSGGVTLSSTTSSTVTFTMPSKDVVILAHFIPVLNEDL